MDVEVGVVNQFHTARDPERRTRALESFAAELTEFYTIIGWNTSGRRTTELTLEMLNISGLYATARAEGQLIGFGRVTYDPYFSMISDVMVHPDFRRKGIGSQIMRAIIQELDAEGRNAMLVDGSGTPEFYAKLGFVEAKGERVMDRKSGG